MWILAVALLLCAPCVVPANAQTSQTAAPQVALTLRDAVTQALNNYPAIRAARANIEVSAAGVDVARTAYLPRADLLLQVNRGTRNSITGLILPQPVIAGVSGGIGVDVNESALGSAMGLMLNWEPFDLGARGAGVEAAETTLRRSAAAADLTELQVATAAAEGFLNVVATEQTLRAATAAVERARVFYEVVVARTNAGLRPGVDAQRARAELALAENQRAVAEQNARVARVVLAQYTGQNADTVLVNPGSLLLPPPDAAPPVAAAVPAIPESRFLAHPQAAEQNAAVEESRARLRVLERSYFPRFNVLFNTYSRGSGVLQNGAIQSGLRGLAPDISNWAVGVNVLFPLMDRPGLGARAQAEQQRQVTEAARYARVIQDLEAQLGRSQALLAGATRISQNTPIQLDAARAVFQQATARYGAGLTGIIDVADAQRLLTQSEIDDAIAKLNIWRGLLLVASAQGSIEPFLARLP